MFDSHAYMEGGNALNSSELCEVVQLFDIQWATATLQQGIVTAQVEFIITYPFFNTIIWRCEGFNHETVVDGVLGKHHLTLYFQKPTVSVGRSTTTDTTPLNPIEISGSSTVTQSMYSSTLGSSTDHFDLELDIPGLLIEPVYITFVCSGKNLTAIAPHPGFGRVSTIINPGGRPLLTSDYKSVVLDPDICFRDCSAYMVDMLQPQRVVSLGTKSGSGKTFGLSMLESFISTTAPAKTLQSFAKLAIRGWSQYDQHLGAHSVLSLDFSVFKVSSTSAFFESIASYVRSVYESWYERCAPALTDERSQRIFVNIMRNTDAEGCQNFKTGLFGSFAELCRFIFRATRRHPVVLIDGYDSLTRKLWFAPHDTLRQILPMVSLILTATVTENMCKYCAVVAGGNDPPVYGGFGYVNSRSLRCSPEIPLHGNLVSKEIQSLQGSLVGHESGEPAADVREEVVGNYMERN
ncbi:Putative ATP-binding protein [Giardia duodenalis]|uniref:Putative ATP-binding protein n=1 Tax=Giardia intestinalis TaxID=5741 RepID=V6TKL0_GIAIN|nr:Putative ATP-binding protein [Giardia intestinalis]